MSTKVGIVTVGDVEVFYRYAGSVSAPVLLLLHGYPSSSHQFRNLMPLLASKYYVVAPDFPGFGFTKTPLSYTFTFGSLATTTAAFLDALSIKKFAMYIFDYGAPVGLRLALQRPEAVTAVITQNGNAYEDGLGEAWKPLREWWISEMRHGSHAEQIRAAMFNFDAVKWQYVTGSPTPALIQPESYTLDAAFLVNEKIQEAQLDLFYDYQNNIKLYPQFQDFLSTSQVPVLAAWGKGDPFFIPTGMEAYKKHVKDLEMHLLDASHFALETNEELFAKLILDFLGKRGL